MKPTAFCLWMASMALLTACDDGRIYDEGGSSPSEEGFSATVEGEIIGCADYQNDSKYSVVLAAFKDGDPFAVVSKPVTDGSEPITLTNISGDVATVEVCVINRLRERIFTFVSENIDNGNVSNVTLNVGTLNVGEFSTIESKIFSTTCAQCHGATGHSAAGLDLMPGEAYKMLVDVPSVVVEGEKRVEPGDASASTLWQAVATDISAGWAFNHANLLTSEQSGFIENWINSGAND